MLPEYENPGLNSRCVSGAKNLFYTAPNSIKTFFTQFVEAHEELYLERVTMTDPGGFIFQPLNDKVFIYWNDKLVLTVDGMTDTICSCERGGTLVEKIFRGEGTLRIDAQNTITTVLIVRWNSWIKLRDRERAA
jgi:hypothetical protein